MVHILYIKCIPISRSIIEILARKDVGVSAEAVPVQCQPEWLSQHRHCRLVQELLALQYTDSHRPLSHLIPTYTDRHYSLRPYNTAIYCITMTNA